MSENVQKEPCPTIGGECSGYSPEYYDINDSKWHPVPWREVTSKGDSPWPRMNGHVLATIGLMGEHQALAMAHKFAAVCEAESFREPPKVRIVEYRIVYDVKATRVEP